MGLAAGEKNSAAPKKVGACNLIYHNASNQLTSKQYFNINLARWNLPKWSVMEVNGSFMTVHEWIGT